MPKQYGKKKYRGHKWHASNAHVPEKDKKPLRGEIVPCRDSPYGIGLYKARWFYPSGKEGKAVLPIQKLQRGGSHLIGYTASGRSVDIPRGLDRDGQLTRIMDAGPRPVRPVVKLGQISVLEIKAVNLINHTAIIRISDPSFKVYGNFRFGGFHTKDSDTGIWVMGWCEEDLHRTLFLRLPLKEYPELNPVLPLADRMVVPIADPDYQPVC